jgi:hypothetical protein
MRSASLFFPLGIIFSIFAAPAQASKIGDLLHEWLFPSPGFDVSDQIQCYNLPFGGIGFLSHILTYYTVVMLVLAKTPLFPRPAMPLRHSWFDLSLSVLAIMGAVPVASMNIYACRFQWEFVCIAVWKLTMSFTLSAIGAHQCVVLFRTSKGNSATKDIETPRHRRYRSRSRPRSGHGSRHSSNELDDYQDYPR